ncbi:SAF domain-containing protein [Yersinia ruckeri]|uniref:SAF domain-containing protein n=2 Tax=Yersinia ruckeri TaxID=29486 RepID=UPI0005DAD78C|nr:SAF domain-containing protein [Yersinia ruckeri]AKA38257.1 hypothetical protein UGYR_07505 [Yersinia ruckeri]EKN3363179.1 hypothetical protein [Yersinia ruckeri]EKN4182455.1 hypothetical protein [Yersinia ruckeri]EKN4199594.1 hypothetical protein [Yersinia ruckeri]EKN4202913.1 hypothetical protein [Yersinia ruckeri]
MNHRAMIILSIFIISIGLIGLFAKKDHPTDIINLNVIKDEDIKISLAIANKDIKPGALLNKDDYILSSEIVESSSKKKEVDISKIKDFNGAIAKIGIKKGSYITHDMISLPENHDYYKYTLQANEIVYFFNIYKKDSYLLNMTKVGDKLTLSLRTLDVYQDRSERNGMSLETKDLKATRRNSYSLNKITGAMTVIKVKQFTEDELSKNNERNIRDAEKLIGYIEVTMNEQDLLSIHTLEKSGDIILTPFDHADTVITTENIIPRLRKVRELRG